MPHAVPVALSLLDPHSLLSSAGALVVFLVLFAETGLLIGFFLPGDSLLFTAGLLCATPASSAGHLSLAAVLPAAAAGALAGAQAGFLIGRYAGHVVERPGRVRLAAGIQRAHDVLERYGVRRAVVLARFIPVVRTVINPVAGAAGVPAGTFTRWQVTGGLVWTAGVTLAGYVLGSRISGIDRYLLPVIAVIVALSLIPVLIEVLRRRGGRSRGPAGRPGEPAGGGPAGGGPDGGPAQGEREA
ncbi:MAG TPA: DedA family protein [Streptosporangiaceae bacterium]|jgi:membrane-associated protein